MPATHRVSTACRRLADRILIQSPSYNIQLPYLGRVHSDECLQQFDILSAAPNSAPRVSHTDSLIITKIIIHLRLIHSNKCLQKFDILPSARLDEEVRRAATRDTILRLYQGLIGVS